MFKKNEKTTEITINKPKKKIKKWKIVVLVIVLLIVVRTVVGIVFGSGKDMLPAVDTAEAVKGEITSTLDTSGTIASEVTKVYASPVNAQVLDVPAEGGEKVQKGEYLLTYDTTSLQKSYDIAELQAKAENATSNDSLEKSKESAADMASSASDIASLQGQIDALNAEINSLQSQATNNELASNDNAAVNEKITKLQTELEGIKAQIASLEAKKEKEELSDKEAKNLKELNKEQKEKEKEIKKQQKSLNDTKSIANSQTTIQAQLTQKNSQLADLQSKLAEAQSKNTAAEAGVLSDAAKANIDYTKQAGKLTLEQTADSLSKAKAGIVADFDGIVTQVDISAGSMAAEGSPLLTLASANDLCVEIPVSKYNLANIEIGQKATVTFQDKDYTGEVNYISKVAQKAESGAALVTVKVHIDTPDDNLVLGLDAKVKIDLGSVENVIKVPVSAVNSDTSGDFVYVVEDNIVVRKAVTTGMASKEEMEIKSGLSEGEKVITTIDATIIEGMQVTESTEQDTETSAAGTTADSTEEAITNTTTEVAE